MDTIPSSVPINKIFSSEDADARFYRDILFWSTLRERGRPFKLTELGNWLLENNTDLRNEFTGSHIPRSYRLHSKRKYFQARLEYLVDNKILQALGTEKSAKNQSQTTVYDFTELGYYLGKCLIATRTPEVNIESAIGQLIQEKITHNSKYDSSIAAFWNILLRRAQEQGFFVKLNQRFRIIGQFFPHSFETDTIRQLVYAGSNYSPLMAEFIIETLKECESELKDLVLFQMKLFFEGETPVNVTREYERLRLANITNLQTVVLQGYCGGCKERYPVALNIFEVLPIRPLFATEGDFLYGYRRKCSKCTKRKYMIEATWLPQTG